MKALLASLILAGLVVPAIAPFGMAQGAPSESRGANAQSPAAVDCTGYLGSPVSGSPQWEQADLNNQQCAAAGLRMAQNNRAIAAAIQANAAAGDGKFSADPFRAPHRWAAKRGSYQELTFKHRDGSPWAAALFGPRDLTAGPYPGVLLVCHACGPAPPVASLWYWAAEALAESGYVVLYAAVGGNNVPRTIEASDFFVSTPAAPTSSGEFNPWHASLDRTRLGIVGHSGAGGVVISAGNADSRYKAVVAWDPAGSYNMEGVTPRIPTMIQVADYRQEDVPPARHEKPSLSSLPKFAFFDRFRAAGVDVMQVALRASMHFEWGPHFPTDSKPQRPYSIYGETVATYYTLAWLDRYLMPSRARDARRRLLISGTGRFDRFADVYSIGSGSFDAKKAERAGTPEAGNVPITIGGMPVRGLLSFQFESRYFFDGGAAQCADMRAGCPSRH